MAYHGLEMGLIYDQIFNSKCNYLKKTLTKNFKDKKNIFNIIKREGVIVTPNPDIMEESCRILDCYGKKYKIGFMTRVNPKKIRYLEKGNDNYWIVNGSDSQIRPYRILIKEI